MEQPLGFGWIVFLLMINTFLLANLVAIGMYFIFHFERILKVLGG